MSSYLNSQRDVEQINCGFSFSGAIVHGGSLFMWGSNAHGKLGLGIKDLSVSVPTLVPGIPPVITH